MSKKSKKSKKKKRGKKETGDDMSEAEKAEYATAEAAALAAAEKNVEKRGSLLKRMFSKVRGYDSVLYCYFCFLHANCLRHSFLIPSFFASVRTFVHSETSISLLTTSTKHTTELPPSSDSEL